MSKLKPVTMEDLTLYRVPTKLLYSPEGTFLAIAVKSSDVEKNEYRNDIWIARDGSAARATWSIDASPLLWLNEETLVLQRTTKDTQAGTTDLYLLSMSGGEAMPWVTLPFALAGLKMIDDRHFAAFGRIDIKDPDAYLDDPDTRKKKAEAKKEEADYQVVDELPYFSNGAGYINGMRTALFLFTVKSSGSGTSLKSVRRITEPLFHAEEMLVHEGKVYFTGFVMEKEQSPYAQVFVLDPKSRKVRTLYGREDRSIGGLFFLDDTLYGDVTDFQTYGINETGNLCVIEKDEIRTACKVDVSLHSNVLGDTAEGGFGRHSFENEFLTLATIRDHNAIFSYKKKKSGDKLSCKKLWEEEGLLCTLDAAPGKIAVVYQDFQHVAEVYEMNRDGSHFTKITSLNDDALAGRYIAEPIPVEYSSEGNALTGWVLLPRNYKPKKSYPAILDIHGGPRCAYGKTFFHEMQVWASKGYFVLFTNIRGSDGLGDAFADIRGLYGEVDYKNLMDFTDTVLAAYPNIDKSKVCVTGGSYGGFMTNWIIGHTDRFCCAVSQRSISNWISFSYISDIGPFFGPDQCGVKDLYHPGLPMTQGLFGPQNITMLWDRSPLKYAEQAVTPTLFIHSDEDYRCPLPEGMQMYQALAARGIPSRMCIFRGENHELSRGGKPKHRIRRLKEMTDWFDTYTK